MLAYETSGPRQSLSRDGKQLNRVDFEARNRVPPTLWQDLKPSLFLNRSGHLLVRRNGPGTGGERALC